MNVDGFWKENGGKLVPKLEPKSILALKRKNQLNASRLVPNWVRRVQDGRQNGSNIDEKSRSKTACQGQFDVLVGRGHSRALVFFI